jgi:ubiquinone/menaquinone biosynthesis C-methylase UbiE
VARSLRLVELALAVEGVALIRTLFEDEPEAVAARLDEVRRFVEGASSGQLSSAIEFPEQLPVDGYSQWATTYDQPGNGLIEVEQPIVAELLAEAAFERALDAACGTGRLTALLAAQGADVIGVDQSSEMLAVARERVPGATFVEGRLDALPEPDASVDIIACGLALAHLPDLRPAIAEFARVVRAGGRVIISDIHPVAVILGGQGSYRAADDSWAFVRNFEHRHADYFDAFSRAGLHVRRCIEPAHTDATIKNVPSYAVAREATNAALLGIPLALIWELERIS